MAVYSMTGYASATRRPAPTTYRAALRTIWQAVPTCRPAAKRGGVRVELRSVNGRFLDLGFRLPDEFRALEPALRELLTARIPRGKIELRAQREGRIRHALAAAAARPAQPAGARGRHDPGLAAQGAAHLSVHEILQWCKGGAAPLRLDERALDAARRCVEGLREARAREGERLVAVLMERVTQLRELAAQAEPLVPAVCSASSSVSSSAGKEALEAAGAAQTISREASAGTRAQRGGRVFDPHRRGRRTRSAALASRRDRAPA